MRSIVSHKVGVFLLSCCLALGATALHIEQTDGTDKRDFQQMEILENIVKEQVRILAQDQIPVDEMVTIDESFNFTIQEEGCTYNLTVGFDAQNNFKIHDVPKHRHLLASRYVTDQNQGIELQVIWETKVCKLKKVYLTSTYQQEKAVYLGEESVPGEDTFNTSDATLLQFVDIDGPSMLRSSLPPSFQPYCPDNFSIFAVYTVRQNWDEIETNGSNETILATNPAILEEGGILSHLSDLGLAPLHRTKRATCSGNCCDVDGNVLLTGCHWRTLTCEIGCNPQDMRLKCRRARTNELTCDFIIMCNPQDATGVSASEFQKCLAHLNSRANLCNACCMARDCGSNMPVCSSAWAQSPITYTSG